MGKKNISLKKALALLWKTITFRSVFTILIVAIVYMLFNMVQYIIAPSRISEELKAEMEKTPDRITRIEVCFDFTPEDFHIKAMQKLGSLAGVTDHSVYMMFSTKEQIEKESRIYWVDHIKLAD